MADWRTEAGLTRFPEDNDVIGVPIDAVRTTMSQEDADRLTLLMMEMLESDQARFARQVGMFGIMFVTTKDRE